MNSHFASPQHSRTITGSILIRDSVGYQVSDLGMPRKELCVPYEGRGRAEVPGPWRGVSRQQSLAVIIMDISQPDNAAYMAGALRGCESQKHSGSRGCKSTTRMRVPIMCVLMMCFLYCIKILGGAKIVPVGSQLVAGVGPPPGGNKNALGFEKGSTAIEYTI